MKKFVYVAAMGIVYITLAHIGARILGGEPIEYIALLALAMAIGAGAPFDD